jgi:hypothetical protein
MVAQEGQGLRTDQRNASCAGLAGGHEMRQEHRFCAEVYHQLHGLIDHSRRVLFCLDGAAAREAAKTGQVECATMPDLCFTYSGAVSEIRIEAKIIERRRVKLGADQRTAWCRGGTGMAVPHLWIGADEALSRFWLWDHEGPFCAKIERHRASKGPILVFPDGTAPDHCTLKELVERIIAWATENGFKPKELASNG